MKKIGGFFACAALAVLFGTLILTGRPLLGAESGAVTRSSEPIDLEFTGRFARLVAGAEEGNLFFSPLSISTTFAMATAGARGETLDEMLAALGWTQIPQDELHSRYEEMRRRIDALSEAGDLELVLANAIWPERTHAFLPEYLGLLKERYAAGVTPLDFANETEAARQEINAWVERQTRSKIKELLQKGTLDILTRMVLTNAVYFRGTWAEPFREELTTPGPFYVTPDTPIQVPMMKATVTVGVEEVEGATLIELPYRGDELSMVVILPEKGRSIGRMEESLEGLVREVSKRRFDRSKRLVTMPKFRMTNQFSLADTFAAMGMKLAFTRSADFSGMDGTRWLYITGVYHKSYVDVSEKGTEAAAATGIVIGTRSAPMPQEPVVIDRPFWFGIRDRVTGGILFLGRVVEPQQD
ncbi:MAG: serpin family protein [Verrucomicrobiota bacterium]|jgi:serpin B|nr:serpin family protein [Verrucomicrobiota bacterium]